MFARTALLVSLSFLLHASVAQGQAPGSQWERTFGGVANDGGYSVEQTSDGGYVIAGYTCSFGAGNFDFYLVKTGSSGYAIWSATFGGDDADHCYSVSQTPDGGYILGGCTRSFGSGMSDFYLVKADESGNMEWDATLGTIHNDWCYSVSQTSDGGYIMCGSIRVDGCDDIYLIKADSLGNMEWEATFGGIEQDIARSVQETADGGYILAGETVSIGAGGSDFYLVKTDASGIFEWDATFGWSMWDRSYSVQQTSDGGYVMTGYGCYAGDNRIYLVKTDISGSMEWDAVLATSSSWSKGKSVQKTLDGGYVVAGTTDPVIFCIVKVDCSGNPEWETTFGGNNNDCCYSVQQTSDGGYILGGSTESFGAGQSDIWLVKVAPPVGIADETLSLIASESMTASFAPNPFTTSLIISYNLPETGQVELSVYDFSGRLVERLASSLMENGEHQYIWNPGSLESGCYLVRLQAGDEIQTENCIYLR